MTLLKRWTDQPLARLAACLLLGALAGIAWGQDANWDLRNYHLYNAWAFLHDRDARDLAAAGMQSFFNPLLDLPYYLLGTGPWAAWPRGLAAGQGLWYGLLLFVLCAIARQLARLQGRDWGWPDAMAVVIGATGTMLVSQAGTTMNEVPLACLVLLGFACLLRLHGDAADGPPARWALLAGTCCGLAVGLKPTAMVYPPAMALAVLSTLRPRGRAWRMALLFGAATALAFLLVYGWWGWRLYLRTGNPCFPLFNQVFRSDWIAPAAGTDLQFRPRSAAQWVFYPFYWLRSNQRVVTEVRFADPRYAMAWLAAACFGMRRLLARWRGEPATGVAPQAMLVLFVASAYVLWLAVFSILRYAVAIEALSGLVLLAACRAGTPHALHPSALRRTGRAMALLAVAAIAASRYPNWGHVPFGERNYRIETGAVEAGSMVFFVGAPVAYLAPFFPRAETLDFVGLTWFMDKARGYRLWSMARQRVASHSGPFYAVLGEDARQQEPQLERLLPGSRLDGCRTISSNLENDRHGRPRPGLQLCRVAGAGAKEPPVASPK